MNRRGFFKTLAAATAGFAILPPATTYQRVWKATRPLTFGYVLYKGVPYNAANYVGEWRWVECVPSVDSWLASIKPGVFPRGAEEPFGFELT